MEQILFPALAGFAAGFVSTMPIGPINLAIIERCLNKKMKGGVMVALGATAVDTVYISLALLGLYAYFEKLLQYPMIIRGLQVTGVIILGFLGIRGVMGFFKKSDEEEEPSEEEQKKADKVQTSDFFLGALLCSSNPFFILFWIATAGWFLNTFQTSGIEVSNYSYVAFILAAIVGDLTWFAIIIVVSLWTSNKMGKKFISWIHLILGILFLACSGYGIYQLTQPLPTKIVIPGQEQPSGQPKQE